MRLLQYMTEEFEVPHISGKSKFITKIKPEERGFKNLPRDGKGKAKCKFQDWLELKGNSTGAKGADGKWYGWSHRAVAGFGIGDSVKKGDVAYQGKEYTIETDDQAKEVAGIFADGVS